LGESLALLLGGGGVHVWVPSITCLAIVVNYFDVLVILFYFRGPWLQCGGGREEAGSAG
jgi:hypothetical protein